MPSKSLVNATACSAPSSGTAAATFASALQFFAAAQCVVKDDWYFDQDSITNASSFDIIIVGAGTAGSILANRLSEIPTLSILILEAGTVPPVESIIPGLQRGLFFSIYDWQYNTADNGRTNQANVNGSFYWAQGKMLGGSSSMNGMMYFKGNYYDYESWYRLGNKEWRPDIVRKYAKKAENLQNMKLLSDPRISNFYGHDGPLVINRFNSSNRHLTENILRSYAEIGIKTVKDLNTADVLGAGIATVTATNGTRQSTASTYLVQAQYRNNLSILTNALVSKVLINPSTKVAYGVEVERDGEKLLFFANKEVILSAGSVVSPQILMLSGIGPKEELRKFDIEVIKDLPGVGTNLQDHTAIPITIFANYPGYVDSTARHFDEIKYLYNRTGYLAESSLEDILAFYSTDKNAKRPEFQIHFVPYFKNSTTALRGNFANVRRYKSEIVESVVKENENRFMYFLLFDLLHPYSRGNITLQSTNIKDYPLINPNYYSDPRDIEKTVKGLRMITKIVNTTYFRAIGAELVRLNWSPCNDFELDSVEYWKCIAIDMSTTIYHVVGTTQMGLDPRKTVVDSRLRVHGLKKLRVVDGGIMPTITSCNTNGPIIMIGERAADLIKEDLQLI